ncbi:hypothetical protein KP001_16290 [Geomonas subterranea]|uniref:Uncharacterized protein n=1 Tax=Geomonas subterranea TaxID=2847989 RepID=A0ABX8LGZ1_9BACT|nr:hypothetical protein [Geomonas subterranea]QXE89965.1 hypothetical protein KP001_16290 [Geomonas subterranea]QXM07915.1 hypothetical protein KP002_12990 [Geomonas subterranea]
MGVVEVWSFLVDWEWHFEPPAGICRRNASAGRQNRPSSGAPGKNWKNYTGNATGNTPENEHEKCTLLASRKYVFHIDGRIPHLFFTPLEDTFCVFG